MLVDRGAAADLDEARSLVGAGRVLVAGAPALSASRAVAPDEPIVVMKRERFVGRGGEKLDAALEAFAIDVDGLDALDVGASTGGFTDCLLSRGALKVLAVDVGRHQLHERLASDPRVVSMERTNIRDVSDEMVAAALGAMPSIVVVDLSFTSVRAHASRIASLAAPDADLVVLVKPQFEVDHVTASRGNGVVRDPDQWQSVVVACAWAFQAAGTGIIDLMASPLRGATGNVEFLVHAAAGREGIDPDALAARAAAVIAGVEQR